MVDSEKVIKGLECIAQRPNNGVCGDCPYFRPFTDDPECGWCDKVVIADDAIALLKEHTAQWIWDRPHHFRCSGCNGVVGQATHRYCPNCGRKMTLSDTERRKEWPEEVKQG